MIVRMGSAKGKLYHTLMISGGMVAAVVFSILHFKSGFQWLFLISFPLFMRDLVQINRISEPRQFDPFLKKLSLTTLLFTVLFGIGVMLI
jgi:1,4-dihydroxy-2-naphthoate octaprenyltransferase